MAPKDPTVELLLTFIDHAYDKKSWHGPTLRGALRGLSRTEALWRPTPRHHNIWEIAIHAAYWKYAVRARLTGAPRGSFPREGSNWFVVGESAAEWKKTMKLLDEQHKLLCQAVSELKPGKIARMDMIYGVASHDLYHAGQIQLLKRLIRGGVVKVRRSAK
jgi:hypothetical protein